MVDVTGKRVVVEEFRGLTFRNIFPLETSAQEWEEFGQAIYEVLEKYLDNT